MNDHYRLAKSSITTNENCGNSNRRINSVQAFWSKLLRSLRGRLNAKPTSETIAKSHGYFRRIKGKDVLDATYAMTPDGQWHGRLRLNNWTVKETTMASQEEIHAWCRDAFMELHVIGYAEEQMIKTAWSR